ncbi:MAG: hypothetical protein JXJ17_19890 [Anaerolineae bacterium]|nr:hypothetical protein [Anaerolineae bacterium]
MSEQTTNVDTDTRFTRFVLLALAAIEGLGLYGLLTRESLPAVIFKRYSTEYFLLLLPLVAGWLLTVYLGIRPPRWLVTWIDSTSQWLRKKWWLTTILLVGGYEAWFQVNTLTQRVAFAPVTARRVFFAALLLALVWLGLAIMLGGRERKERGMTIASLGLAVISLLVSFWLFSVVLTRVIDYRGSRDLIHNWGDYLRYDLRMGYRGKANLENYEPLGCPEEAKGVTYFTDSRGYRNPPGSESAPIAVVGDSYVFGVCLDYDDMWSTQIGKEMGVEAASYGVIGTSLWYYNQMTDIMVRDTDAEVLIYGVFINDLIDDSHREELLYERMAVNGILYYMSPVNYTSYLFFEKSPLTHIIDTVNGWGHRASESTASPENKNRVELDNGITLDRGGGIYSEYLTPEGIVGERLNTAQELAGEMGMTLVVVTIPSKRSIYNEEYAAAFPEDAGLPDQENEAYDTLCNWMTEQGRYCYNLTDDMREAAKESPPLCFTTDGHWNATGTQTAARLTADYLREKVGIEFE